MSVTAPVTRPATGTPGTGRPAPGPEQGKALY
jgi:hypothetical protein